MQDRTRRQRHMLNIPLQHNIKLLLQPHDPRARGNALPLNPAQSRIHVYLGSAPAHEDAQVRGRDGYEEDACRAEVGERVDVYARDVV